jgi:hypothetical protein
VAPLIPYFRQISAVDSPASCSLRMPITCSSLNLLLRIVRLLSKNGLYLTPGTLQGAGSRALRPKSEQLALIAPFGNVPLCTLTSEADSDFHPLRSGERMPTARDSRPNISKASDFERLRLGQPQPSRPDRRDLGRAAVPAK